MTERVENPTIIRNLIRHRLQTGPALGRVLLHRHHGRHTVHDLEGELGQEVLLQPEGPLRGGAQGTRPQEDDPARRADRPHDDTQRGNGKIGEKRSV